MALTRYGCCCYVFFGVAISSILLAMWFEGNMEPTGDLPLYYAVDACLQRNASFSVAAVGFYATYVMRPVLATDVPDTACPLEAPPAPPTDITLEEDDEFRAGAFYNPVVVMPDNAYATLAFEILDSAGVAILPTQIVALGPDAYYPWTASSEAIVPAIPSDFKQVVFSGSAVSGGTCGNTCVYQGDGACDDGGANSSFSMCLLGSDCADCGPRASIAAVSTGGGGGGGGGTTAGRRLLFAGARSGLAAEVAHEVYQEEDEDDEDGDPLPAHASAGARRLLKGSFGGGKGASSASSGGGTSGGRSVGRSSGGVTRSSFVASSSQTSFSSYSSSVSHSGTSYGGHRSYHIGHKSYHMPGRAYHYRYGAGWYSPYMSLMVVNRWGYGCYSCYGVHRTCYQCGGCQQRSDCGGGRVENGLASSHTRYELSFGVTVPESGSARWPLTFRMHNLTIFTPQPLPPNVGDLPARNAIYLTYITDGGQIDAMVADLLKWLGWPLILITSVALLCCKRDIYKEEKRVHVVGDGMVTGRHAVHGMAPPARRANEMEMRAAYMAAGYPGGGGGLRPGFVPNSHVVVGRPVAPPPARANRNRY